ncbi:hypothetical protein ACFFH2_08400 [Enterococcus devriesei]|nr:hypothetical protein [Enterococcus devriesei]
MKQRKIVGLWVDQMNKPRGSLKGRFLLKVKNVYDTLKESIERNWFIMTFSFILAIPLLIAIIFLLNYISSLKLNYEDLQNILSITGMMMGLPLFCMYLYLVGGIGKGNKNLIRVMLYLAMIIFIIVNVGVLKRGLKSIEVKRAVSPNLIFSTMIIDVYIFSFVFTKAVYSLFKVTIGKLRALAFWIVKDEGKDFSTVEAKLSFINKIITGFLAIVASILGLLLTLNKIL